jgi:outer membrane receptor protein involved in Fe transport
MNRPLVFQLSPFVDFTDSLNLTQGNPSLRPEFTNSFEVSYQKIYKGNNNLLLSIYYKNATNMISMYTYDTLLGGQHRIINSYINANSGNNYGLEIIMRNIITKWWDVNANFNIFSSKIRASISDKNSEQNRIFSYFIKVNNNIRFLKDFTFQLNADYISRRTLPPGGRNGGGFYSVSQTSSQAYLSPNLGVDLALRYNFFKEKRASIAISVNDVLRTRKIDVHSESPIFVQNTFRRINPQLVRISFGWKFGKVDVNFLKRKNMRAEQEGGQEAQ